MPLTAPTISVATADAVAFVKLTGRANFSSSVQFKRLLTELQDKGYCHFVLDLTECLIMDSTFLGVLAALAQKLSERNGQPASPITLFNANPRICDLLDNLGVARLFKIVQGQDLFHPEFCQQEPSSTDGSKVELSKTCLEAHRALMAIHPGNIPKFKDVTQFFAEDLKKSQGTP